MAKNGAGSRRRVALVTGAAAGLGASFAERLARDGFDVVLVDHQSDRVQARAIELAKRHGVAAHALVQDLQVPGAGAALLARCEALGLHVDLLVNNAGFHLNKFLHELPWSAIADNLQLLMNVVVETTHRFLPGMLERGWGRIINVASVSGFMPGGVRLATYNATKAFLIPFSEGLNLELKGTGVQVTALCPGFMRTDLFVSSGLTDVRDSVPNFMWLEPDRVAADALKAVMRGTPVHIAGVPNRLIVTASKFVPRTLLRDRTKILHKKAHGNLATPTAAEERGTGRRAALVTGATAGIGASFTEVLAREGYDVVLVARREELLKERAAELSRVHGVKTHVIVQDLSLPGATDAILAEATKLGWPIDVLVNNAGYPVNELFAKMSWAEVEAALQILVGSVVHLTHALLPGMIARKWGRVINVASMAGFEPGSYRSTLYSSSKAFVIGFSESVNAELEGTGVGVTALCPGFTKTEWISKNNLNNASLPSVLWMESKDVAEAGFAAAKRSVPVSIVGTPAVRMLSTLFQLAPRRSVGWFLSNKRRKMFAAAGG